MTDASSARVHIGMMWLFRDDTNVGRAPKINGFNPPATKYTATLSMETARPSSGHTGLVNVAMLGGSVTTLSEGIDYHVYQALMTLTPRPATYRIQTTF